MEAVKKEKKVIPSWLMKRVCVQLRNEKARGVTKEAHGNTAVMTMEDK